MKKKMISVALIFALALGIFPTVGIAAEANELTPSASEKAAVIATLQYVEEDKSAFNLDGVEFSDLYIGNKIYAYEYTESGLDELYFTIPIFYHGEIIALATKVSENNFQISGDLAYELNRVHDSNIALVYDSNSVYTFNGDNFSLLDTSPVIISNRQSFQNGYPDMSANNVMLCDLNENVKLNYTPSVKTRVQTYFSCSVKYVPQKDYENLCWAATIACIVNYVDNKNLTVEDVAKKQFGSTKFDKGKTTAESAKVLRDTYNLNYTYLNSVPSDNIILENIQKGYPLYGSFGNDDISHAATVFGINVVSGYITIMDPMTGSHTVYSKNGTYSYINTTVGEEIFFDKTICSIWR